MRGAPGGQRGSLWDSDLVAGVAFHPRKCSPCTKSGVWIDSDLPAADGTRLAYRLYTSPHMARDSQACVLVYFHANAELCTDTQADIASFFDCGFCAVLCPEFRGYAWSGGKPSLKALAPDADAVMQALPEILSSAGLTAAEVRVVLHGRSLGSACAVYLASRQASGVCGLIVESGVMDLLKLPMVMQLGLMMPQMLQALKAESCPLRTLQEIQQVTIPTLVFHGDMDEISPIEQAVACHQACASSAKKLVRYPRAGHNDLRITNKKEYFREVRGFCEGLLSGGDQVFYAPEPSEGLLGMLGGALRCFPGMRRCLNGNADDASTEH
eukprot:TRINITY_DN3347_c0_g2_i4.p1 TRINITY_DN3347_c0_g2~~TRINITY_DN3347_c0_g2_i4.p1  ORF type:complete len:326 (+),score=66.58 TRINITY_DN3347_c0_g2_i4:109-1086(+)